MKKPSLLVWLASAMTLGSGIINIVSVIGQHRRQPTWFWREVFPLEFLHISRFLALFIGFVLIISSINIYKSGSLPSCVGGIHGKERSDLEDLAFPSRSSRESNEVGRRVCLSTREFNPITLLMPEKYGPTRKTNVRSYAGAEKNGEGMALKIRRERRHFRVFYNPICQQ